MPAALSEHRFHGSGDPLSNFWVSAEPFIYKGCAWPSREHFYMANKLMAHNTRRRHHSLPSLAKQWAHMTPQEVKAKVSQMVHKASDKWLSERLSIMREILLVGALTDRNVFEAVLQPGITDFIHTLPEGHSDAFWSIQGPQETTGQNNLGILWGQVRSILQFIATGFQQFVSDPFIVPGTTLRTLHPKLQPSQLPDRLKFLARYSFRPDAEYDVPLGTSLHEYLRLQEQKHQLLDIYKPKVIFQGDARDNPVAPPPNNKQATPTKSKVQPLLSLEFPTLDPPRVPPPQSTIVSGPTSQQPLKSTPLPEPRTPQMLPKHVQEQGMEWSTTTLSEIAHELLQPAAPARAYSQAVSVPPLIPPTTITTTVSTCHPSTSIISVSLAASTTTVQSGKVVSTPAPVTASRKRHFPQPIPLLDTPVQPVPISQVFPARSSTRPKRRGKRAGVKHKRMLSTIPTVSSSVQPSPSVLPLLPAVRADPSPDLAATASSPSIHTQVIRDLFSSFPAYRAETKGKPPTSSGTPNVPPSVLKPKEDAFPLLEDASLRSLCPICRRTPGTNIARHVSSSHLPWWWRWHLACHFCKKGFPQLRDLTRHATDCQGPPFNNSAAFLLRRRWCYSVECLLTMVAQSLGIPSIQALFQFVTEHRSLWGPPMGAMDTSTSLELTYLARYWQEPPPAAYTLTPPNSIACLGHWRILVNLIRSAPIPLLTAIFNFGFAPDSPAPHRAPGATPLVDHIPSLMSPGPGQQPVRRNLPVSPATSLPPPRVLAVPQVHRPQETLQPWETRPQRKDRGIGTPMDRSPKKLLEGQPSPQRDIFQELESRKIQIQQEREDAQVTTISDAHFHVDEFWKRLGRPPTNFDLQLANSPFTFTALVPSFAFPFQWSFTSSIHELPATMQQFALGWHPKSADLWQNPAFVNEFVRRLDNSNCVAVGEVGLDYSTQPSPEQEHFQTEVLMMALSQARHRGLPVVFHCREDPHGAYTPPAWERLFAAVSAFLPPTAPVYLHCFTGDTNLADRWRSHFHHCIFGYSTKAHNSRNPALQEVFRDLPLSNIVLESDSPCLKSLSGSFPSNVALLAEYLAKLRHIPVQEVVRQTTSNVKNFYDLDGIRNSQYSQVLR